MIKYRSQHVLDYRNTHVINRFLELHPDFSEDEANAIFVEMLKFLYVASISQRLVAPSIGVDETWHVFILFTKDYREFCHTYLNRFIEHIPRNRSHSIPLDTYDYTNALLKKNFSNNKEEPNHIIIQKIFERNPLWHQQADSVGGGFGGFDGDERKNTSIFIRLICGLILIGIIIFTHC